MVVLVGFHERLPYDHHEKRTMTTPTSAKRAKGILYTSTLHLRVNNCHVANSDTLKKISRILDLIYEIRQSVVLPMCSVSYWFGNSLNLNIEVSRLTYQCPFGLTMETPTFFHRMQLFRLFSMVCSIFYYKIE